MCGNQLTNPKEFAIISKASEPHGEMSEWLKEPVLKTGDVKASVGSNPTLSAKTENLTDGEVPKRPKGLPC